MNSLGNQVSAVALGEVMLRFDPGASRVHTTRRFDVWEGGGEYNVIRSLRRTFGQRAAIVTALVDNPVGRLAEDMVLQAGVDPSHIIWREHDGVGRSCRNGLNFTDRGFGSRAGVGCYDRGHTAVSQLTRGQINWDDVFASQPRLFHTGGVFVALGEQCPEVALEGMRAAKANACTVSFDLNYRDSLWRGNSRQVREVMHSLVSEADVLFGNAEQFATCLGHEAEHSEPQRAGVDALTWVLERYPHLSGVFCSTRFATDASSHRWGAVASWRGERVVIAEQSVSVFDRVGGGDAAAAGFLYGVLADRGVSWAARCAVVHGALAMSTPGDNSMVTLEEVELAMESEQVRMVR
jgi:2-dehydro-3-deoxygluconokinase